MEPITREEVFLNAAAGNGGNLPDPITREEMFLAKAAGEGVTPPEPITRKEMFLQAIADGGGGGGGGGNPNYIETIMGTLANPFGSIDAVVLAKEIADGDATATLTFEAENETWVLRVCYEELDTAADDEAAIPFFYVQYPDSIRSASYSAYARVSYDVYVDDDTEFLYEPVVRLLSANEETDVDFDTVCTLTIIHHPLPEGGDGA